MMYGGFSQRLEAIMMLVFGMILVAFLVAMGVGVFHLANREYPVATPIYKSGEFVTVKLSGQRGMVLSQSCFNVDRCSYNVRLVMDEEKIPHHLLGSGGKIQKTPLATVYMREFELEPAL